MSSRNWSVSRGCTTSCMSIYASKPRTNREEGENIGRHRRSGLESREQKKEPWRARRALGVNEGRSCDRSIFPKRQNGPIRRFCTD
ncbi:hypothetical protein ANTPLA_LOCUS9104 [Anthophora plagiata]